MSESRLEILVGIVVLALSAGFLWYLLPDKSAVGGGSTYEVSASFNSAQGVAVGSDIRIAGVKIGEVSGMTLDTEQLLADLQLSVQSSVKIPDDSQAAITAEGLLGEYFVEILPGGSFTNLENGDEIFDTQSYVGLMQLLTNIFFE